MNLLQSSTSFLFLCGSQLTDDPFLSKKLTVALAVALVSMNPEDLYRAVLSATMPGRAVRVHALQPLALKRGRAQRDVEQQVNPRPSYALPVQHKTLQAFYLDPEQQRRLEVLRSDLWTQTILGLQTVSVAMAVYSSLHHLQRLRVRSLVQ